jgi:hypothetical protein
MYPNKSPNVSTSKSVIGKKWQCVLSLTNLRQVLNGLGFEERQRNHEIFAPTLDVTYTNSC